MSDHQQEAELLAIDLWDNLVRSGNDLTILSIPLASLLAAQAELVAVKKRFEATDAERWQFIEAYGQACMMIVDMENERDQLLAELSELKTKHENLAKYARETWDKYSATQSDNARLRAELAMANDAADKGKAGRELGTALEGCVEENKQLRADLEAVRNSYRAGNEPLINSVHTRNMCELFDVRDNLRAEVATFKGQMANGQKQLSDLEDTVWKREKELAELHEAFADALKMGEQTKADNADKERKLKLVGYYGDNGKEVQALLADNALLRALLKPYAVCVCEDEVQCHGCSGYKLIEALRKSGITL